MSRHDHLWNDLPAEERHRLMPYQRQTHALHLRQVRSVLVANHKRTLAEIDAWIANIERDLDADNTPSDREKTMGDV